MNAVRASLRSIMDRSSVRALLAILATLALVVGVTVQGAAPAAAASTISIDNVSFDSDTIVDGTRESLTVEWSIPDRATNPVTMSVDFPSDMKGYPDRFDMKGPNGENAGECVVSAEKIECTVDPAFIDANPQKVKGSFHFNVETSVNNEEAADHTFDFGGHSIPVTVEPNPYTCTEDCEFPGYKLRKFGTYNSADDTIRWTVRIPAPADGIPGGQNITIADDLDTEIFEQVHDYEGETWPQLWEARCIRVDSGGYEAPRWVERSTADWNADQTEVSFASRDGNMAGSCIKETTGSFYEVHWIVKVKDLGAAGTYENKASYAIEGGDSGSTTGKATRHSGGGDVEGSGSGRFSVTKDVTGTAAFATEDSPEFTVDYTAYPDDAEPVKGSFTVKAGETYQSEEFYKGTRIVIDEVKPTEPANVDWADPVFTDASGAPVTEFTFSEEAGNLGENIAALTLTNKGDLRTNTFSVKKTVENPDGVTLPGDDYTINWRHDAAPAKGIPAANSGTWAVPGTGEAVTTDAMVAGIDYYLSEATPATVPGATWDAPTIVVDGTPVSPTDAVALGLDSAVNVEVTNRITQDLGGFTVSKEVSGSGADLVEAGTEFEVTYSWPEINGFPAGSGSVKVKAGETSEPVTGIPAGATVTLDEIRPIDPVGGSWGEPKFDQATFTVVKDQNVAVSLDNPIELNSGDFSVTKKIAGDGADLVADDTAFTIDYDYTLPESLGGETGSGQLTVKADGTAVTSDPLPYGTTVTLSEAEPAQIAGGTWTSSSFDPNSLTIGDGTTVAVTLTNTIEKDLGSFTIDKKVLGSGAHLVDDGQTFTVDYSYPAGPGFEAGSGSIDVTAGEPATVKDLPAGAVVTLAEAAPKDPTGGTWQMPVFVDGSTIVIEKGGDVKVALENTIELDAGAFSLVKKVEGSGADLVSPETTFTVEYSYPKGPGFDAGTGSIVVKADGTVVTSPALPYGAEVTFSELEPTAIDGAQWTGAAFSESSVTIGDDTVTAVTLTNTIEKDETGTDDAGIDGADDATADASADGADSDASAKGTDAGSSDAAGTDAGSSDAGATGGTDAGTSASASAQGSGGGSDGGDLPRTGANAQLGILVPAGLLLIALGTAAVLIVRRRRQ